jgi:hypothetical protein
MTKLTVVFLKDSGHVLAALTRADPPAANEPVSALVETGLPLAVIDGAPADVTFPVANLDAVTVDDQPEVLLDPQGFQVIQDPQNLLPPKVTSVGVVGSVVTPSISATTGAAVQVTGPPPLTLMAVVVLQNVTAPAQTRIRVGKVTPGSPPAVVDSKGVYTVGDKWTVYTFVQTLQPTVSAAVTVGP